MKTKIIGLIAGLTLALTGCASDFHSVTIRNAIGGQPTPECTIALDDTVQSGSGSLDVGLTNRYIAAFLVENNLTAQPITARGETINGQDRNDFHIKEIVLRYSGDKVTLNEKTVTDSGNIAAGGRLAMGVDLFTADNIERLRAQDLPAGGLRVNVEVIIRGTFAHDLDFETAPFSYPITIHNSCPGVSGDESQQVAKCLTKKNELCAAESLVAAFPDPAGVACGNLGQDSQLFCTLPTPPTP